jgi:hypothetical protein
MRFLGQEMGAPELNDRLKFRYGCLQFARP